MGTHKEFDVFQTARIISLEAGESISIASLYEDLFEKEEWITGDKMPQKELIRLFNLIKEHNSKVKFIGLNLYADDPKHNAYSYKSLVNRLKYACKQKGNYYIISFPELFFDSFDSEKRRYIRNIIEGIITNNAVLIISDARVILNLETCTREEYLAKGYISFHGGYYGG